MKRIAIISLIAVLLSGPAFSALAAQEAAGTQPEAAAAAQPAPAAETKMAYGEVVTIDAAARTVTIKEYDYEADKYVDSTYSIAQDVKLEGDVANLNEVKMGDFLDVEYNTEAGQKTAVYLYIERPQAQTPAEEGAETPPADTETE